jgi:uncharacterized protein YukE
MATVDELVIQIKADVKDLNKKMKKVNRQLDDVGKKGSKGMGATNKAGKNLNTTLMGLKGSTVAVVAALAGVVKIGGAIARVGSQFEDLKDSLDSVFGSIQAGDKAMQQVFTFAQTTPFQIETATKAFIQLKSAGIEPSMEQLQVFADTASVSVDQLGTFEALIRTVQRSASGGMGLEELNMISDRGIDVLGIFRRELDLGKDDIAAFGKTAEGAAILVEAMTKGLQEQFGGAMETKMDNLSTKTSNMTIAFKQLADDAFNSGLGPFLKMLTDEMTGLAEAMLRVRRASRGEDSGFVISKPEKDATKKQIEELKKEDLDRANKMKEGLLKEIEFLKNRSIASGREIGEQNDGAEASINAQLLGKQKQLGLLEQQIHLLSRTSEEQKIIDDNEKATLLRRGQNIGLLEQVHKAYQDMQDPLQDIKDLLEDENRLLELMELNAEDAFNKETFDAYKSALEDFVKESEKVEGAMEQIMDAVVQSSMTFTKDFTDALLDGENALESFKNFSKDIVSQIIAIFLQMAVVNRILNAVFSGFEGFTPLGTIGGSSASTNTGTSGGGGFAGGGTAQPRMPIVVGERGPEIFVPNTGGSILNNMNSKNAMGGGDIIINQNLNFSTGVVGTVRTEVMKLLPTISEVTKASVMDSASRGGNFAKVIRG